VSDKRVAVLDPIAVIDVLHSVEMLRAATQLDELGSTVPGSDVMRGILVRMLVTAGGLWLASALLPGVDIAGYGTLLLAAILYGLVNALVRPVVILLTLPITVVSLGLFLFCINAAMFGLVAAMLDGFTVAGFFSAVLGAIIVSMVSGIASWYIGPDGRYEVIVIQRYS